MLPGYRKRDAAQPDTHAAIHRTRARRKLSRRAAQREGPWNDHSTAPCSDYCAPSPYLVVAETVGRARLIAATAARRRRWRCGWPVRAPHGAVTGRGGRGGRTGGCHDHTHRVHVGVDVQWYANVPAVVKVMLPDCPSATPRVEGERAAWGHSSRCAAPCPGSSRPPSCRPDRQRRRFELEVQDVDRHRRGLTS